MTPEQKEARIKKLISAAKALLSLQVGLAVGARRIERALYLLGPEIINKHTVFAEFISAIPTEIPIGSPRLMWEPKAMLKSDPILAKIEAQYRTVLLEECINIIDIYC